VKAKTRLPVADEDLALRALLQGTARETGENFFRALVENLAKALGMYGAWVTEYLPETHRLKALALWFGGQFLDGFEMGIDGTPCEAVVRDLRLVHHPHNLLELYPNEALMIHQIGAVSYMGYPLLDLNGELLGHLAVMDKDPMPPEPRFQALLEIFAARAAAEFQRLRAESQVREREEELRRLVSAAMDAIIEMDEELNIKRMNPAAEKIFVCKTETVAGRNFLQFLSPDACRKLNLLAHDLKTRPEGEQYIWIAGNLEAIQASGKEFLAEASLSRYELRRKTFYTLILRNVNDRLEAERKIRSLQIETEYLKEEIKSLQDFSDVIGQSPAWLRVLRDVQQVGAADTTVLIAGETGTGKELIARAIHAASPRREKPLIKVNCAAIPSTLMESEFFGHEAGAFTGATKKREGRFDLADRGTIFLDEIGELPLDVQAKLLRVLQEGEFEPVGSSHTKKINVRVIVATNRNLEAMIREGKFREDLYYRVNVFPILIPPLRDRGEDVILLARSFAAKIAKKMGRKLNQLAPDCIQRLKTYTWPGNVRELQNVMERAVITSLDGNLNFDRALPTMVDIQASSKNEDSAPSRVRTAEEINELERKNLIRALESTGWRIAGNGGAAQLLGLKPSTLSSRMKALGIQRPGSLER
jgi:PAS domain S-box-containing protein